MKAIVIDASMRGLQIVPCPFSEGETVHLDTTPLPEWFKLERPNAVVVKEYPTYKGMLSTWPIDRFMPISDQDNLQLSEEEAEAIRKRQISIKWQNPNNDF